MRVRWLYQQEENLETYASQKVKYSPALKPAIASYTAAAVNAWSKTAPRATGLALVINAALHWPQPYLVCISSAMCLLCVTSLKFEWSLCLKKVGFNDQLVLMTGFHMWIACEHIGCVEFVFNAERYPQVALECPSRSLVILIMSRDSLEKGAWGKQERNRKKTQEGRKGNVIMVGCMTTWSRRTNACSPVEYRDNGTTWTNSK